MALTNDDLQAMSNLLDDKLKPIKDDIDTLEKKITSLELTLENETNHGIKIIAEGHLDLSRKLDQALKVENEKEILLRVNHLENELRKVKERISQIA